MTGAAADRITRLLDAIETAGGELVLTRQGGRWYAQCVLDTPGGERDVAFGHGPLTAALEQVVAELRIPPLRAFTGRVGYVAGPAPRTAAEHAGGLFAQPHPT